MSHAGAKNTSPCIIRKSKILPKCDSKNARPIMSLHVLQLTGLDVLYVLNVVLRVLSEMYQWGLLEEKTDPHLEVSVWYYVFPSLGWTWSIHFAE